MNEHCTKSWIPHLAKHFIQTKRVVLGYANCTKVIRDLNSMCHLRELFSCLPKTSMNTFIAMARVACTKCDASASNAKGQRKMSLSPKEILLIMIHSSLFFH